MIGRRDPGSARSVDDRLAFDVEPFGWEDAAETIPRYRLRCRVCSAVFEARCPRDVLGRHLRSHKGASERRHRLHDRSMNN
jgi:hypothetical protein